MMAVSYWLRMGEEMRSSLTITVTLAVPPRCSGPYAEQRGGTANVTVIVSDERISSPILSQYDTAIILNQPSLEKFEGKIKPGGILIYDGYGIIEPPTRRDIRIYRIDAMDAANEKGMAKTFNMIVLGGLLKLRPVVSIESVIKALRKTLPERHHHLIPMNEEAIRIGMEIIKPQ